MDGGALDSLEYQHLWIVEDMVGDGKTGWYLMGERDVSGMNGKDVKVEEMLVDEKSCIVL